MVRAFRTTGAGHRRGQRHRPRVRARGSRPRAPRWSPPTGTPTRLRDLDLATVVVDLADLDAVDRLDLAVDIVVNNAGLQHVAPIEEFPPERFSYLLR